ncbi:subtilisin-like protease SBT1.4 [Coffea eugenioides]|uniref:Subtilisin-like protease SBT1.4 n=1 Tax=Coffea arabica TaxID=13443 RepID=A0A6P6XAA1_COFAR|nr:subtilisin-like protease SBT1.4 [Coffea arabica]XP_027169719.1 subtilisin-like protease SBT1.4 [Coffea eugenioides]
MASLSSVLLILSLFYIPALIIAASSDGRETYIVHVAKAQKPSVFPTHHHWYSSILRSLSPLSAHHPPTKLIYTYDHAVHGYSARLSSSQAAELRRRRGVLSVVPDSVRQLHTTRTPHFLGLDDFFGIWPNSDYAEDVIVAVLDTGIWPEHPSFSDEGLPPVPSSWKGVCETGPDFPPASCNKKIIGARAYYKGYEAYLGMSLQEAGESKSPRDSEGHGTHTASTAAGSVVKNASLYEYARGEARGMAIKARVAAYKICWTAGCFDSDILAAMDQAIDDGVHVISLSVGANGYAPQYDHDSIAIGAFGAAKYGIVTSCSAGNSGPGPYTAVNIAPWILTVGASTIDREFPADVVLGDGSIYGGVSVYAGEPLGDTQLPLVYAGDCGSRYCYEGRLDSSKVKGKIVICDRGGGNARVAKGSAVKLAGGGGMILANLADSGEELISDSHLIPATNVGQTAGDKIKSYLRSEPSPTATIVFRGTVIGSSPSAPRVAAFSSRGPNHLTPEILKPDVIAPGVNILAGWTGLAGPSQLDIDPRRVEFNIASGTSMSCPHVSGLAALLRKAHPKWTPAAIKSALMTTAYNVDNIGESIKDLATGEESNPFVHGSGHVDPNRALNPGLVYDLGTSDYVAFLCAVGYSPGRIAVFVRDGPVPVDCGAQGMGTPGDLNYPSFSVVFSPGNSVVKYTRVVKNVGSNAEAVYEVKVNAPPSVEVTVSPSQLVFSQGNDTLSYEVSFTTASGILVGALKPAFGSLEWSDGEHLVRSPIAVVWRLSPSAESM